MTDEELEARFAAIEKVQFMMFHLLTRASTDPAGVIDVARKIAAKAEETGKGLSPIAVKYIRSLLDSVEAEMEKNIE
ncbi:MAG: hypothetical protein KJ630_01360 [Proteobacteria bacterium]|nr:hypothetical protein [Pseudomonadota bacterium]